MSERGEGPPLEEPPDWGPQTNNRRSTGGCGRLGHDRPGMGVRPSAMERDDERHDEYDDPDQGGEA
jgi:hypothetical protein